MPLPGLIGAGELGLAAIGFGENRILSKIHVALTRC